MNKKKINVSKEDMNVKELRALAVSLGVMSAEEAAEKSKKALLPLITAWEEKRAAELDAGGAKKLGNAGVTKQEGAPDMHMGKKVVSRTPIVHNDKKYIDILVETGETFRELDQ